MKIVVTGDLHLDCMRIGRVNPITDLDLRIEDFLAAFDRIIDHAIAIKADLFILNGDLFKGRTSTHHIETLTAERFKRIAMHMRLIINLGNHDYTGKSLTYGLHTYSIIQRFGIDNVVVNLEINHIKFDGVDIVLYPYYDCKSRQGFKDNEQLLGFVKTQLDSFKLTQPCKLFVGHGTPEGTMANDNWFFDLGSVEEPIIPQSYFQPFEMSLFSHIHRLQFVTPAIFHIGSPERVDFAEAKDDKGFAVYDTDIHKLEFVSTNPRPMVVEHFDFLENDDFIDPTEEILTKLATIPNLSESLLKISAVFSEQSRLKLDTNRIKHYLQKAYFALPPKYDTIRADKLTRIAEVTENLSETEALEKVLESRLDLTEQDKKQLLIRGKGVIASETEISSFT